MPVFFGLVLLSAKTRNYFFVVGGRRMLLGWSVGGGGGGFVKSCCFMLFLFCSGDSAFGFSGMEIETIGRHL
jgi:hypothetical protein